MIKTKTTPSTIEAFKTIVYDWHHMCGHEAHCLIRMYERNGDLFFLLSELSSNRRDDDNGYGKITGLSEDFVNLVNLVWKDCLSEKQITSSKASKAHWIKHYGSFSSNHSYGPESFTEVILEKRNNEFIDPTESDYGPDEKRIHIDDLDLEIKDVELIIRDEKYFFKAKQKSVVKPLNCGCN